MGGMKAERVVDPEQFAALAGPLLERDPVRQTQLCSLIGLARRERERFADANWFTVSDGDTVLGAAGQSQPFGLILTPMPEDALAELAATVRAELPEVPGAVGPRPYVDRFAALWRERGGTAGERMAMRLFRCDEVDRPDGVSGAQRTDSGLYDEHHDLLVGWVRDFVRIIEGEEAREPERLLERLTAQRRLWVWFDGGAPVSFASTTAAAYGMTRVGLVYTPPELHGHGYASANVAALTRHALDHGLVPVLFTDLANPTSNRIYRRIGYQPVTDAAEYVFAGT
jgi:GNAT superfamily N-acetyltransferase